MKNKTYLILAFLALFSLSSHSYFHISEFDLEHNHELDHEHEKESCDQCNLAETSFFVDEDFNNENQHKSLRMKKSMEKFNTALVSVLPKTKKVKMRLP